VYPEKTKDIGASDIRSQILSNLYIKPYKYKYKVFILENADNMSPQAQNALLKILDKMNLQIDNSFNE
jgi:DNA polymerase-3 subunit delta'